MLLLGILPQTVHRSLMWKALESGAFGTVEAILAKLLVQSKMREKQIMRAIVGTIRQHNKIIVINRSDIHPIQRAVAAVTSWLSTSRAAQPAHVQGHHRWSCRALEALRMMILMRTSSIALANATSKQRLRPSRNISWFSKATNWDFIEKKATMTTRSCTASRAPTWRI